MKIALLAALLALTATPSASAQVRPCGKAEKIAEILAENHDEEPVAIGLQVTGNLLQIYADEAGGTWTVVITYPTGLSCVMAAGTNWELLIQPGEAL